jgi:hypothetical protein
VRCFQQYPGAVLRLRTAPSGADADRTLSDPKAFQPRRPALIKYRFMGRIGMMEDVKRLVWE